MSDAEHNDPGMIRPDMGGTGIGAPGNDATGILPVRVLRIPPGAFAPTMPNEDDTAGGSPAEGNDPHPQRMGPERWVIGGGTVVALVAAFIAFSAGGTPSHAMPSPFTPQPAQSAPAQSAPAQGAQPQVTPATCTSLAPAP